ncbi:MAG: polyprenyl synthetase family protein [Desulfuromonadaceae bacterium]|nr:polyprenyl synthetase family protein [Desulfuromonadaceae bacterium]
MMSRPASEVLLACEPWRHALSLQQQAVQNFYDQSAQLLHNSCSLCPLPEDALSLERNLFSTLFIMASEAAGVPRRLLPFYAEVFQCLRAQVTGCDNLLDDEYKSVIPFDLEGGGTRFRSVLTVMTADLVLGRLAAEELEVGRLDLSAARGLFSAVMDVLIPSGLEEHEEESQAQVVVPTVRAMQEEIHYRKTGLLFEAPVRLVQKMGLTDSERVQPVLKALSLFGGACQILDDLKDVADDLNCGKHNIVVSSAFHGVEAQEREVVVRFLDATRNVALAQTVAQKLPVARQDCVGLALRGFQQAAQAFETSFPQFGLTQAVALGTLVQKSILSERNENALSEKP